MKPRIVKRPQARQDMLDHFAFIGEDSPAAAERFFDAAEEAFQRLAEMPNLGRRWISASPHLGDVRVRIIHGFPNYLVFYRRIEDGIEILRVLHSARDIETILENL